MSNKQMWFITGEGCGLGVDLAKAASAAGHSVVATGRNPAKVAEAVGGKQGGDPAKLAAAIVQLAALDLPPARFAGGVDAVEVFEKKARSLLAAADAHRALSTSLAHADSGLAER